MNIGENIRKRRIELNMSQQKLAELTGYKTRSSISKIEKGCTELSHSKLNTFSNVLNTSIDYLLTGIAPSKDNKNMIINNSIVFTSEPEELQSSTEPDSEKIVAVILAGGQSTRNHQNTPNQFVNVHGKPVILYTLESYQNHPAITAIYVVSISGWENIITAYAKEYNITKLSGIIPAGETGILSVKSATEWLSPKLSYQDIIIFQEATRPMVSVEMISNVIRCAQEYGSAIMFEPMDEHLQFIQTDSLGLEYIERSKLISIQSPEAYRFRIVHQLFMEAQKMQHIFEETCCAMLMYKLGKKLIFCPGNRYNIKIVRQEDIKIFHSLIDKK